MIEASDISKAAKETLTETIDGDLNEIITDDLINDIMNLPIVKNRISDFIKEHVSDQNAVSSFIDSYRLGLKLGIYTGFLSIKELVSLQFEIEEGPQENSN